MAGAYRFLAVLITVVGLTLAQSPQEPQPDSGLDETPLVAPVPPPNNPEPLPFKEPGIQADASGPVSDDPSAIPDIPEDIDDTPAFPNGREPPVIPTELPAPPPTDISDPPDYPPSKSDIPEPPSVPEKPIPAPFVDLNEPSPAPPTDPENLEAVPPTVLDELAPSPRAFPDESVNQGPPNFFDLPPPFGIPGPLGPEDLQGIPPPFSPFGQPDDSSLVGLPSPFGLPGPFGASVDVNGPSDSFGFSGPAGFYGFPNFPGSDFSATSLNDENSPEDIQGLYDSPLTNGGETEGGFPPIPGILPGFPPAPAQNPPQSFKQPPDLVPDISPPEIRIKPDQTSPNVSNPSLDIPPETAAKVDKSVEPIPGLISGFFPGAPKVGLEQNFPGDLSIWPRDLLGFPGDLPGFPRDLISFPVDSPGFPNLPGLTSETQLQGFPNVIPGLPPRATQVKVEHSVSNIPGLFPNFPPETNVKIQKSIQHETAANPSLLQPPSKLTFVQSIQQIPSHFPGPSLLTILKTGKRVSDIPNPPKDTPIKTDVKSEQGVGNIPRFNLPPLFPDFPFNENAQIPEIPPFAIPPFISPTDKKSEQNVTTYPVLPGLGLSPFQPILDQPLQPHPFGIGPWPLLPQGVIPTSDAKTSDKPVSPVKDPYFPFHIHEVHTHQNPLPLFPTGLPVPFASSIHPLFPGIHQPILSGSHHTIIGGILPHLPGVVIPKVKNDKVGQVSPRPQTTPSPPTPPSPSPSPATGGETVVTTAKVPTKNEQYTDILKELLDEVKAVQKENAARDE